MTRRLSRIVRLLYTYNTNPDDLEPLYEAIWEIEQVIRYAQNLD